MKISTVPTVFDTESDPPFPLGRFDHVDEDTVVYYDAQGRRMVAPYDCVKTVDVVISWP